MEMKRIFALFLLPLAVASCGDGLFSDSDDVKYELSVEAVKGSKIAGAAWKTTDEIYVRKDGAKVGSLTPQSAAATARLKGELDGTFSEGDHLTFSWPDNGIDPYGDYTEQDGKLETIAGSYDYLVAEADIKSVGDSKIEIDPLTFSPRQAIVKFVLQDADGHPVCPTRLTLDARTDASQLYTNEGNKGPIEVKIDQSTPTNEIFVALKQATPATSFSVTAEVGRLRYSFVQTAQTMFEDGQYLDFPITLGAPTMNGNLSVDEINFNFNLSTQYTGRSSLAFVFFEGVTTGYFRVYMSGGRWSKQTFVTLDGKTVNVIDLLKDRKLTAVLLPQLSGEDKPVFADGKWSWGAGYEGLEYYSASNVVCHYSEENDEPTLSADIAFNAPANPGITVNVRTPNLDANAVVKVACNNLVPTGFKAVSPTGELELASGNQGDWLCEVNGLVHGRLATSLEGIYYYALDANLAGTHSYYHFYQTRSAALADGDQIAASASTWKQVGPGHFVTVAGRTFWTTNLSADRHSPVQTPWVSAELTWTTENQWNTQRYQYSLSEATFDYNSELPDPFNWKTLPFYFVTACGTKGIILADWDDQSNFIFLPLRTGDDFYFYAIIRKDNSEHLDPNERISHYSWHYNWHYWAKDYTQEMSTHVQTDGSTAAEHWKFNWTSTLCFASASDASEVIYSYYLAGSSWGGIPDYAIMDNDNQPLYFPARPVKK